MSQSQGGEGLAALVEILRIYNTVSLYLTAYWTNHLFIYRNSIPNHLTLDLIIPFLKIYMCSSHLVSNLSVTKAQHMSRANWVDNWAQITCTNLSSIYFSGIDIIPSIPRCTLESSDMRKYKTSNTPNPCYQAAVAIRYLLKCPTALASFFSTHLSQLGAKRRHADRVMWRFADNPMFLFLKYTNQK